MTLPVTLKPKVPFARPGGKRECRPLKLMLAVQPRELQDHCSAASLEPLNEEFLWHRNKSAAKDVQARLPGLTSREEISDIAARQRAGGEASRWLSCRPRRQRGRA